MVKTNFCCLVGLLSQSKVKSKPNRTNGTVVVRIPNKKHLYRERGLDSEESLLMGTKGYDVLSDQMAQLSLPLFSINCYFHLFPEPTTSYSHYSVLKVLQYIHQSGENKASVI